MCVEGSVVFQEWCDTAIAWWAGNNFARLASGGQKKKAKWRPSPVASNRARLAHVWVGWIEYCRCWTRLRGRWNIFFLVLVREVVYKATWCREILWRGYALKWKKSPVMKTVEFCLMVLGHGSWETGSVLLSFIWLVITEVHLKPSYEGLGLSSLSPVGLLSVCIWPVKELCREGVLFKQAPLRNDPVALRYCPWRGGDDVVRTLIRGNSFTSFYV